MLGRAGHGSCWDQGVDAIADMGVFLACFQRHCNELHRRDRNPSLDFGSAHAGKIPGGEETSTCPAHATFTVERRTLPLESDDRVQEELVALLPEAQTRIQHDFKGTIRKLLSRPPLASRDVPLVQLRRLPSHSSGHEVLVKGTAPIFGPTQRCSVTKRGSKASCFGRRQWHPHRAGIGRGRIAADARERAQRDCLVLLYVKWNGPSGPSCGVCASSVCCVLSRRRWQARLHHDEGDCE